MKKQILLAALTTLCLGAQAQGSFKIEGDILNANGQKVIINYGSQDKPQKDSTIVKDGKFSIAGTLDVPCSAVFVIFGEYNPYSQDTKYLQAYADAGSTTTITADLNNLNAAKIKGGKTQSEKNQLDAMTAPVNAELEQLNKDYYASQDNDARNAIRAKMEPYQEFRKAAILCFVKTNPDSYVAAEQMRFLMGDMSYDEIKAVYDPFTAEVKASPAGKEIAEELATLAKVQKGAPAPDFTATDINGKSFTLSSLKGKVVILDFWASWCVPCRKSNPHMLELYKKYHDKGLEMVYVSDDDSSPDKWRDAVEKDQLKGDGFHHVLRGMKWDRSKGLAGIDHSNDISDKYAIHYLPTKYLVDRDGNIVCKIREGEDEMLDLYLSALLK